MIHKILCIDDESHNLEALQRLLRKNYQVETAESGAQALEKLGDHTFSLIISDQKMPNMTGVEFFAQAKLQQPDAVRILLTGYTDLESVIDAINQGQIYRYITKPWEPEEFLSTTRQALEVFEMKKTIKEQNDQLAAANQELKSLDQLKTDFMLLVNHELKTPLTGIFSYVQLLGEEKLQEDQALYLSRIEKNTQRLQDLINDTLLITKLKSTDEDVSTEPVDIVELIQQHWNSAQSDFTNKNLTLKIDNSPGSFTETINRKYIDTLVKKLVHNSLQHSKTGSLVTYQLTQEPEGWTLTTSNQLTKPLEQNSEALLKAFHTNENILNHSGGSGLGLAVIKTITELFRGSINIKTNDLSFEVQLHFPKTEA